MQIWEPSVNRISPGPRQSKIDKSTSRKGLRTTSSQILSISARGVGSIDVMRVRRLRRSMVRLANLVDDPDPISIKWLGFRVAKKPHRATPSSPVMNPLSQQSSADSGSPTRGIPSKTSSISRKDNRLFTIRSRLSSKIGTSAGNFFPIAVRGKEGVSTYCK